MTQPLLSDQHVTINDDRVTVKVRDVTVRALLTEIARQTGLVLVLSQPLNEHVSVQINARSLPEALGRILKHKNFALQYVGSRSGTRDSGHSRNNWLWVLPATAGDDAAGDELAKQFTPYTPSITEVLQTKRRNARIGPRRDAVKAQALEGDVADLGLALTDEDAKERVAAVHALAEIGGDQAVAALVSALADENPRVRIEATHALGEIGDDSVIEILVQPFHDADKRVRQAAIEAFTDIGGDRSARALATALQDPDASLRKQAVDALGQIGGPAATQILQRALKDEEDQVRQAAIDTLTDLGGHDPRGQYTYSSGLIRGAILIQKHLPVR